MKKFCASLLISLVVLLIPAKVQQIPYCIDGKIQIGEDLSIKKMIEKGWIKFDSATQNRMGPATFYKVNKKEDAQIIFMTEYLHPTEKITFLDKSEIILHRAWPAYSYPSKKLGIGKIYLFGQYLKRIENRHKYGIVSHELFHIFFHLPDTYWPILFEDEEETNCLMGDLAYWNWNGNLCKDCLGKVNKILGKQNENTMPERLSWSYSRNPRL